MRRFPGQFLRRTELIKRSLRLDDEPKWWCREPLHQRQCASVKLLLHGVFCLVRCLDERIEVLLHARLLGKGHRQLRGRTALQEDGLRPSPTQTPEVVGGDLKGPHLIVGEQEGPSVKTRV